MDPRKRFTSGIGKIKFSWKKHNRIVKFGTFSFVSTKKIKKIIMQTFEAIKSLVESAEADVLKFSAKANMSAGTRVRQSMQELKKLAQQLRIEIQEEKSKA
jgi:capsule polysaccharide export protein KpsE/RkpR